MRPELPVLRQTIKNKVSPARDLNGGSPLFWGDNGLFFLPVSENATCEVRIDDEVLRTLHRELDFTESRVRTGSILVPGRP
jgi:hypothetical protein